jgi:hypothetical protein
MRSSVKYNWKRIFQVNIPQDRAVFALAAKYFYMLLASSVTGKEFYWKIWHQRERERCFRHTYEVFSNDIILYIIVFIHTFFKCILECVNFNAFDNNRIACVLLDSGHVIWQLVKENVKLNIKSSKYKESEITLKWMTLNSESEIQYSLRPGFVSQNCSWVSVCCGIGTVNVQVDITLATFVTVGRAYKVSPHSVSPS